MPCGKAGRPANKGLDVSGSCRHFTMSFMASDINSTWHLKIFLKKKEKKRGSCSIFGSEKNNKWKVLDECVCKEKEQGVAFKKKKIFLKTFLLLLFIWMWHCATRRRQLTSLVWWLWPQFTPDCRWLHLASHIWTASHLDTDGKPYSTFVVESC